MRNIRLSYVFAAVLIAGAGAVRAEDSIPNKLTNALLADVEPSNVPPGYSPIMTEPFALGDSAFEKKAVGAAHALFERKNRAPGQPEFDGGQEGFGYYVFTSPQDAQSFAAGDDANNASAVWMGDVFRAKGAKTTTRVTVRSPDGASTDWRCRSIDYAVSCIRADGVVVIEVILQEPKLRDATSDTERQSTVQRRAQTETNAMFKTALLHLARARKAAGS